MEKLTREEVLHVARLARISVNDEEIEKYSTELKELLEDIDKIREVKCNTENILVTPTEHNSTLREDDNVHMVDFDDVKENFASTVGRFVEVPVINHE